MRESIPLKEFRLRVEQLLRQAISDDYVGIFLNRDCGYDYTVFDWIKYNVETTSGWETWGVYNDDDIKLAVGRVLDEYFFPSLSDASDDNVLKDILSGRGLSPIKGSDPLK